MPNYEICSTRDDKIDQMASDILAQFETHAVTVKAKVSIDILMAYANKDEDGQPLEDAIKSRGIKALGLCRIVNVKDRSKGMGDVEITLDGDWWADASEAEQRALLDHELHHIAVVVKDGAIQHDPVGRPKIKMRKHDQEFGWFNIIAARHGQNSQECVQAKTIADTAGQFYWPWIFEKVEVLGGFKIVKAA